MCARGCEAGVLLVMIFLSLACGLPWLHLPLHTHTCAHTHTHTSTRTQCVCATPLLAMQELLPEHPSLWDALFKAPFLHRVQAIITADLHKGAGEVHSSCRVKQVGWGVCVEEVDELTGAQEPGIHIHMKSSNQNTSSCSFLPSFLPSFLALHCTSQCSSGHSPATRVLRRASLHRHTQQRQQ